MTFERFVVVGLLGLAVVNSLDQLDKIRKQIELERKCRRQMHELRADLHRLETGVER